MDAFLPNFVSTVSGLVLGLPLAMWANRWVVHYTDRKNAEEHRQRLIAALTTLVQAATTNSVRLRDLTHVIADGRIPLDIRLDVATWEVVKQIVIEHFGEPGLQSRVANHFAELEVVPKLCDLYLNYSAGIAAAIGGSDRVRAASKETLLTLTRNLAKDATTLAALLNAAITHRTQLKQRSILAQAGGLLRRMVGLVLRWIHRGSRPELPFRGPN